MPPALQPGRSSRARTLRAWVVVVLTVIAVWIFVDYRSRPPMINAVTSDK
jgi:hypothetical protein